MSTTLHAYVTEYSSLKGCDLYAQTPERLAECLYLTALGVGEAPHEWVCVGSAAVTIDLLPRAAVITQQVAALQAAIKNEHLESGVRLLKLKQQINSLLCIEGAAVEVAA